MDNTPPQNKNRLMWTEETSRIAGDYRIFTIRESECRSPKGTRKIFSLIDTRDWAMVIPVRQTERGAFFVMVKQWRHGARELSVEFPGGVIETGENLEDGARRELREETGFSAGKLTPLGTMNPNPAIMTNHIHFFLAEELTQTGVLDLDEDEFVETAEIPVAEVHANMGTPPYIHALTAAALTIYSKQRYSCD